MKLERWQQVDELLEAALERAASERTAFLKQACDEDEALRQEVLRPLLPFQWILSRVRPPQFR